MTSTPYPSFRSQSAVDPSRGSALAAVGRCRLHPTPDELVDILEANLRQASLMEVSAPTPETKHDEDLRKRQRKKHMKEGVGLAKAYLDDAFGGKHSTASIVAVEVALEAIDLVKTQGCLACCFLDAGCQTIVVVDSSSSSSGSGEGENDDEATSTASSVRIQEALRLLSTILPIDRLCGHFPYAPTPDFFQSIDSVHLHYCSHVSVELSAIDADESTLLSVVESLRALKQASSSSGAATSGADEVAAQASSASSPSSLSSSGSISLHVPADAVPASVVATVCRQSSHDHSAALAVTVALVNPTSQQLGEAYAGCLKTDRDDQLFTTIVCNRNNEALGLVYSSVESLVAALECGRGVYWSRSRGSLWRKGDTSGHVQTLHRIDVDCDGDALRFTVTQETPGSTAIIGVDSTPQDASAAPAFCHLNTLTCWGMPHGLRLLELTLQDRLMNAPEGSYTKRLFDDDELLRNKLVEEAQELSEADNKLHAAEELADLLYFAMVKAVKSGVSLDDAVVELDKRTRKVTRRQGDSKEFRIAAGKAILSQKVEAETSQATKEQDDTES